MTHEHDDEYLDSVDEFILSVEDVGLLLDYFDTNVLNDDVPALINDMEQFLEEFEDDETEV